VDVDSSGYMSRSYRERIAIYLTGGIFIFSGVFVALWVLTPEFSATGGTLAGVILGTFTTALIGVLGRDIAEAALMGREKPDGNSEEV
jgi:UDP-N-acetylmuramyl pentapeptide phosphotransferase/UDP-N-acetylglucosamine-1-phosphate transferase